MNLLVINSSKLARSLGFLGLFILVLAGLPLVVEHAAPVIAEVAGTRRKLPIYAVATDEKRVAISFDAAWGADRTPVLLDILDKHKVKTTFFLVTFWVKRYPEVAAEIARRGHEIGLHSTTHPHMNTLGREGMAEELQKNRESVQQATGQTATLFRPPFGEYGNTLIEVAESMGLYTIQWSIDSLDWMKGMTEDRIVKRVLDRIHNGAIILFHNNGEHTPAAVDRILASLLAEGYQVIPISQLIYTEDFYIDHQGFQHRRRK